MYTKHGIGLSVLIAVPWAVAGRFGADVVVMIAASLLTAQMYLLGRESGANAALAGVIAVALASASRSARTRCSYSPRFLPPCS
ncbi:MAG: hypothetical protein R2849_13165 [Thermomicrobiales bacterium]